MTTTTAPAATWKLTGSGAGGNCEECGRRLAVRYTVTSSTGQAAQVGRGCLKKVTGWTLTAAQAARELKIAERNAARAARWAAWSAANPAEAAIITADAEREAGDYREGRTAYAGYARSVRDAVGDAAPCWQDYLAEYLGRRAQAAA